MLHKCCIVLVTRMSYTEILPGSISGLFRKESVGFSLDAIVFLARQDLSFSLSLYLGELMLGRLIKAPDQ